MATKVKYWTKIKKDFKEVIIDVKKLGYTEEEWAILEDNEQDFAVGNIPSIMKDWGYAVVRG